MEVFLTRAAQLILSLSILVIVHEFGHFIFAKIFHVRVERFYMFFNPGFSLVRVKRIDGKLHFSWFSRKSPETFNKLPEKTEFGVGWLPLGGYCTISGMIDESMNTEQMKQPVKSWEFRSKPAFQRLMIMVAGVLLNFILALFIYAAVLNVWGEKYLPMENASMGMEFSPAAQSVGFRDGDVVLYADAQRLERFDENAMRSIVEARQVKVLRNKKEVTISIPADFMQRILAGEKGFASFRFPAVVKDVVPGSVAKKGGLIAGDSLTAVQGVLTPTYFDFVDALSKYKGKQIKVSFYRNGAEQTLSMAPDENGKLGFMAKDLTEIFQTKEKKYSLFASIPGGIKKGVSKLTGYASDMKYAFTKEGAKNLGGFGAIGSMFPPVWSWEIFWNTTAFLSVILAFMNILPIPGLDGGHIFFLLVEVITRRKPSDKFLEYAQMVGMFLLLALLIYANGNDIYRWLFK